MVAHVEDAVHHVLLGLLEDAVFRALLDQVLDLVLGDGVVDMRIDAEKQHDCVCGGRQESDEGPRDELHRGQRAGMAQEDAFRVLHRDLFRDEFAEE